MNKLQIDLANLNISKITFENDELLFTRELDAVLINFPSTIIEDTLFEFTIFYNGIPQNADNPPGLVVLRGQKIKKDVTGLQYHVKEKVQEFGGQTRIT